MRTDLREGAWIHVEDPDQEEQAWLRDGAGIPADWVGDALDPYQRPRFQRSGDLVLLIVLCPRTARRRPEPFATVPLGIVLLPDRAVTICRRDPDLIEDVRGGGEDGARSPPGPRSSSSPRTRRSSGATSARSTTTRPSRRRSSGPRSRGGALAT
jgi:Mg2+ and Co2+ transporter CorA